MLLPRILERFPNARTLRYPEPRPRVLPFVHLVNAGRPRRRRRGPQDRHQALAAPRRRRPLAAPPDRRTSCPRAEPATLARFLAMPDAGVWVADGQHYRSPDWWGSNEERVAQLLARSRSASPGDLAFPAGSMYWLKPSMVAMSRG